MNPEQKEDVRLEDGKGKKGVIALTVIVVLLLFYMGSYFMISRSEFAQAKIENIDKYSYFLYPKPGPVPNDVPMRYRVRYYIYSPMLWVERISD